ncbi:CLUMA_CG012700, isoform A [Clunio marinus]|uniref:CLUMA_CG012700, isoform A n=1 Tax=Clunio marinus TaxID=568069 RepID=A0A1J1IGN0_9DIPT|nr:CLUMA_CG012700, isoform A [Clunio marinus]
MKNNGENSRKINKIKWIKDLQELNLAYNQLLNRKTRDCIEDINRNFILFYLFILRAKLRLKH